MGFRVQRSFRIAKGVRLNLSKSGLGVSFGVPGLRYSAHSSGRRTVTAGIPGSGVRYQQTLKRGPDRVPPTRESFAVGVPLPKPGLFAPKGEKRLVKAIQSEDPHGIAKIGDEFPEYRTIAHALAGYMLVNSEPTEAKRLLGGVFASGRDPSAEDFAQKYVGGTRVEIGIAQGVSAALPLDRDAVGLALAELNQRLGDPAAAAAIVEQLDPSMHAAVSLAELYTESDRHQDVIDLTDEMRNSDDATALLCVFRGEALHALGFHDAAIAAFKEALRSRSRAAEIRHLALSERARVYEAIGKRAMARKDLERILADDSTYEGLSERLASLAG